MKTFQKVLALGILGVAAVSTAVFASKDMVKHDPAIKQEIQKESKINRARIVNMIVELELPDGSTVVVDNMDFCTPGGFYNGVEAVVFGDEAVRVMQAGMAALYPKVGDSINQMWQNKNNADDPRLPTYLMIRAPESANKLAKLKGEARPTVEFGSSSKVLKIDDKTPVVMSTCGGYYHPDERDQK